MRMRHWRNGSKRSARRIFLNGRARLADAVALGPLSVLHRAFSAAAELSDKAYARICTRKGRNWLIAMTLLEVPLVAGGYEASRNWPDYTMLFMAPAIVNMAALFVASFSFTRTERRAAMLKDRVAGAMDKQRNRPRSLIDAKDLQRLRRRQRRRP